MWPSLLHKTAQLFWPYFPHCYPRGSAFAMLLNKLWTNVFGFISIWSLFFSCLRCFTCTALEDGWDTIYSSADMSLTRIKRWKASVLTYWTAPFCPAAPAFLSIDDYNCPFPKAQPENIQMELTPVLHKIQAANLLAIVIVLFMCMCMHVKPGPYSSKALTKLWI